MGTANLSLKDIFKFLSFIKKDPKDKRDYKFTDTKPNRKTINDLPDKVEYGHVMTWPLNQGKLGSCVGCAGTAIAQYYENLKTVDRKSNLSEMYLYWECEKIDNHAGVGTYPKCAMQVLKNKGIPIEAAWPYEDKWDHGTLPQAWADTEASNRKIESYYRITTLKQTLKALAEVGPVLFTTKITNKWFNLQVPHIIDVEPSYVVGIHAICLCGYDLPKQRIHFINSWGWQWGDAGSAWMSFDYFNKYMVDCWVSVIKDK